VGISDITSYFNTLQQLF